MFRKWQSNTISPIQDHPRSSSSNHDSRDVSFSYLPCEWFTFSIPLVPPTCRSRTSNWPMHCGNAKSWSSKKVSHGSQRGVCCCVCWKFLALHVDANDRIPSQLHVQLCYIVAIRVIICKYFSSSIEPWSSLSISQGGEVAGSQAEISLKFFSLKNIRKASNKGWKSWWNQGL